MASSSPRKQPSSASSAGLEAHLQSIKELHHKIRELQVVSDTTTAAPPKREAGESSWHSVAKTILSQNASFLLRHEELHIQHEVLFPQTVQPTAHAVMTSLEDPNAMSLKSPKTSSGKQDEDEGNDDDRRSSSMPTSPHANPNLSWATKEVARAGADVVEARRVVDIPSVFRIEKWDDAPEARRHVSNVGQCLAEFAEPGQAQRMGDLIFLVTGIRIKMANGRPADQIAEAKGGLQRKRSGFSFHVAFHTAEDMAMCRMLLTRRVQFTRGSDGSAVVLIYSKPELAPRDKPRMDREPQKPLVLEDLRESKFSANVTPQQPQLANAASPTIQQHQQQQQRSRASSSATPKVSAIHIPLHSVTTPKSGPISPMDNNSNFGGDLSHHQHRSPTMPQCVLGSSGGGISPNSCSLGMMGSTNNSFHAPPSLNLSNQQQHQQSSQHNPYQQHSPVAGYHQHPHHHHQQQHHSHPHPNTHHQPMMTMMEDVHESPPMMDSLWDDPAAAAPQQHGRQGDQVYHSPPYQQQQHQQQQVNRDASSPQHPVVGSPNLSANRQRSSSFRTPNQPPLEQPTSGEFAASSMGSAPSSTTATPAARPLSAIAAAFAPTSKPASPNATTFQPPQQNNATAGSTLNSRAGSRSSSFVTNNSTPYTGGLTSPNNNAGMLALSSSGSPRSHPRHGSMAEVVPSSSNPGSPTNFFGRARNNSMGTPTNSSTGGGTSLMGGGVSSSPPGSRHGSRAGSMIQNQHQQQPPLVSSPPSGMGGNVSISFASRASSRNGSMVGQQQQQVPPPPPLSTNPHQFVDPNSLSFGGVSSPYSASSSPTQQQQQQYHQRPHSNSLSSNGGNVSNRSSRHGSMVNNTTTATSNNNNTSGSNNRQQQHQQQQQVYVPSVTVGVPTNAQQQQHPQQQQRHQRMEQQHQHHHSPSSPTHEEVDTTYSSW